MAKKVKFPVGFFWGASTSAHQVEGGNKNDWSQWEKLNSKRLAGDAKHHFQLWQLELFPSIRDPKNYISGGSADHYNRFEEDFDIVKKLGHNAHRFSIEWSRIEPEEGKFDKKEIEHYRQVILALRKRGIEPFVTLWHWTLPTWLRDAGGWTNSKTPHYFSRYAAKLANELGADVTYWITINEPMVYAGHSYLQGNWPPQIKSLRLYLRVVRHLVRGHRLASNAMRVVDGDAKIGIAKHNIYFEAYGNKSLNRLLKKAADWWWNLYFLNNTKKHMDFIGLNHYFRNTINYGFNKNEDKIVSELGWEVYPESIYHSLRELRKYKLPIIITENGIADSKDERRGDYIRKNLINVHRAMRDGADVQGYLHWSLLDNFEWDKGFWPRFGLVEVDYKTQKRIVRKSAKEYAKIIRANAVESE